MAKLRLDLLLVEQGKFESRAQAQAVIMSGVVFLDGKRVDKPGTLVPETAEPEVRGIPLPYVSRGGFKLEKALDSFGVDPAGKCCIDCGASTGGFTDCLLQRSAIKVYAVDVGYGQLDWQLRKDNRVVVMERTNIRHLTPDALIDRPALAVIDVSFISLRLVLPAVYGLLAEDGEVVCLIKPQFEAGREQVGKKGVVRDPAVHQTVLERFLEDAKAAGFGTLALDFSPIRGPEGNVEYLGHLKKDMPDTVDLDISSVVEQSHYVE
ncbi:MAG: TlyA family RNA methyltransferase [Oscillospiraceae bacterium]|nr:TlyA family RNA methyltransferase [Oscillospiraceae bacterium]